MPMISCCSLKGSQLSAPRSLRNRYGTRRIYTRKLLLLVGILSVLGLVLADNRTPTSPVSAIAAATQRWMSRINNNESSSPSSSAFYWKEIIDPSLFQNFGDDLKDGWTKTKPKKDRLGRVHCGRIQQVSIYEGSATSTNNNNRGANDNINTLDHPLRTNLWTMTVNWSLLAPKSKSLSGNRERTLRVELDPEGYCRITDGAASTNSKDDKPNNSVLGIGRWKKRPWGVTMIVRPLVATSQSDAATTTSMVDEDTEFVFHARGFHWNGFGKAPKLTQGTILVQKQTKRENSAFWWKSSTVAHNSILPVWPEEVSPQQQDEETMENTNELGSTYSKLFTLSKARSVFQNDNGVRKRWFRPVVGTFKAKGII